MLHFLAALVLLAPLRDDPPDVPIPNCISCAGCVPTSDPSDTDSYPGCGTVGVALLILSGDCCRLLEQGTGVEVCKYNNKCQVTITRSWSLTTGQPTFCLQQGTYIRCSDPPAGAANSHSGTWVLACGDGYTWSITAACAAAPGGKLDASARGCCSECGSSGPCQFG